MKKSIEIQGYILSYENKEESLTLELESKLDSQFWMSTFSNTYIEDLTMKTGCHKKFTVFLALLASAFNKSTSVTFEILTLQDLENLKSQKSAQPTQPQKNNKRYLIINYSNEFEKVHYPLTLNQIDSDDSTKLISTIQRLKKEMNDAKSSDFGNSRDSFHTSSLAEQLKAENEMLRERMKQLEEGFVQKRGAIETDNMIREKQQLEGQLDNQKKEHSNTIRKLQVILQSKEKELWMRVTELNAFKKELNQLIGKQDIDLKIQEHVQQMNYEDENEIAQARKQQEKFEREIDKVLLEIEQFKKLDSKQKQRLKQLETEIEQSLRKFTHKSDRGYSPYSNASSKGYSRNSPNSSKNSFNSRNSSNSAPAMRNKSPVFQKPKPIAKVQSATVKQYPSRSPVVSRTPPNRVQQQVKATTVQRNYSQNQNQIAPTFQRKQSPNPEFRDNHFQTNNNKQFKSNDLDQKINNLRNLLTKAQK